MYISSYATYIPLPNTTKTNATKEQSFYAKTKEFSHETTAKLSQSELQESSFKPVQNPLFSQDRQQDITKFKNLQKKQKAQNSYEENSSINSFMQLSKPKILLSKEYKIPPMPKSILQEKGVHTYIENDNYYKITAA